jgi:hypothetical protein
MVPSSTILRETALWLRDNFNLTADYKPNKSEGALLAIAKKSLYEKYVNEFKSLQKRTCSLPQFYGLWNGLFPEFVNRPWCDIPGKCDTCYEIDMLRRTESSPDVQEALSEAHYMHRGGLFMLERQE